MKLIRRFLWGKLLYQQQEEDFLVASRQGAVGLTLGFPLEIEPLGSGAFPMVIRLDLP